MILYFLKLINRKKAMFVSVKGRLPFHELFILLLEERVRSYQSPSQCHGKIVKKLCLFVNFSSLVFCRIFFFTTGNFVLSRQYRAGIVKQSMGARNQIGIG